MRSSDNRIVVGFAMPVGRAPGHVAALVVLNKTAISMINNNSNSSTAIEVIVVVVLVMITSARCGGEDAACGAHHGA